MDPKDHRRALIHPQTLQVTLNIQYFEDENSKKSCVINCILYSGTHCYVQRSIYNGFVTEIFFKNIGPGCGLFSVDYNELLSKVHATPRSKATRLIDAHRNIQAGLP